MGGPLAARAEPRKPSATRLIVNKMQINQYATNNNNNNNGPQRTASSAKEKMQPAAGAERRAKQPAPSQALACRKFSGGGGAGRRRQCAPAAAAKPLIRPANSSKFRLGKALLGANLDSAKQNRRRLLFAMPIISLILLAIALNSAPAAATAAATAAVATMEQEELQMAAAKSVPVGFSSASGDSAAAGVQPIAAESNEEEPAGFEGDAGEATNDSDNAAAAAAEDERRRRPRGPLIDRRADATDENEGQEVAMNNNKKPHALRALVKERAAASNWPRASGELPKFGAAGARANNSGNSQSPASIGTKLATIGDLKMLARRAASTLANASASSISNATGESSFALPPQLGSGKAAPKATSALATKKLNNATLKKLLLLQQSLQLGLAASNGTRQQSSPLLNKANNFKLVFIQRATAAPSARTSPPPPQSPPPLVVAAPGTKKEQLPSETSTATPKQSLAASVSKQLASSLLYSAANLVGNLTSVPSLSALASQAALMATSTTTTSSTASNTTPRTSAVSAAPAESTTSIGLQATGSTFASLDSNKHHGTRRNELDAAPSGHSTQTATNELKLLSGQPVTKIISLTKNKSTTHFRPKGRPSKIYRLPLKFVANGQANGIVLHTLKQHFSMIKRIQAAGTKGLMSAAADSSNRIVGGTKKLNSSNGGNTNITSRPKGTNSRLIYLPLKYLSNAKPNMLQVMATRASHKSTANHFRH